MRHLRLKHWIAVIILFILLLLLFSSGVMGTLSTRAPSVEQVGDITYISGGVGKSESDMMKSLAGDYQLEIVLMQKLKQSEEYLADINVQVFYRNLKVLLNIDTDGPYLLMNLPQGKYLIMARYEGLVRGQWVVVGHEKHQNLVYW